MPTRPFRACPRCGKTIAGTATYCVYCDKIRQQSKQEYFRQQDEKRGTSTERGYNYKWRIIRAAFLKQYPFCDMCGEKATEVHHIIPHKGDSALMWDRSNLLPLCKACHSMVTMTTTNKER